MDGSASALRAAGAPSTSYRVAPRPLHARGRTHRTRTPCLAGASRRGAVAVSAKLNSRDITTGLYWSGDLPSPPAYQPGVIPGVRTVPTPLLSPARVVERLSNSVPEGAKATYGAFYSNAFGGIVTDPGLMFLPIDDHFVHKGHGTFETIMLKDGHLYMLHARLARLKASAARMGVMPPYNDTTLMRIILDVAAASRKQNGLVTVWLTAGRGGFSTSALECPEPGLYVMASGLTYPNDRTVGHKAVSVPTAAYGAPYGGMRSNQFLPHVLAQATAEADGQDVALLVDKSGHVTGSSLGTLAIITPDATLVHLPADADPPSLTLQRLIELIPEERKRSPDDVLVQRVEPRAIAYDEVLGANEVLLLDALAITHGVVSVDGRRIADGLIGTTTLALHYMLDNDAAAKETGGARGSPLHTPVPYGYVAGMRDQLV